jgi:hypothetical protein
MNYRLKELIGDFCGSMSLIEDDFEERSDMDNHKAMTAIHDRFLSETVTEDMIIQAMIIANGNHSYDPIITNILNHEGVQILKLMRSPIHKYEMAVEL